MHGGDVGENKRLINSDSVEFSLESLIYSLRFKSGHFIKNTYLPAY